MAQRFNPADVWQPFGTFAMGVVQGRGRIVHLKARSPSTASSAWSAGTT